MSVQVPPRWTARTDRLLARLPQGQRLQGRPWARRTVWALAALLAFWALAWLAVPPLARHFAQSIASQKLGRTVTIGRVDFRPWSLEVAIHDLAIAGAPGDADTRPQLQVKRLYADAELQSILRLAPVIDAIEVDAPRLRLAHLGQGHYDVDDILHKLRRPDDEPPSDPARFALYNLRLNGGELDLRDHSVQAAQGGKLHTVRELDIGVPFLSNLPSKREVKTEPHLSLVLNGSRFDSGGQSQPFAQTRKTDASLRIAQLDLQPYLAYLPASLPVRLLSGVVDADLQLAFEQNPEPTVRISGTAGIGKVRLTDAAHQDLLAFDALRITAANVQPLARQAHLARVALHGPQVNASRSADGRINWMLQSQGADTDPAAASSATKNQAPASENTSRSGLKIQKDPPTSATAHPPAAARPWQLRIDQLAVDKGRVQWRDDAVATAAGAAPARLALTDVAVQASAITWPLPAAQSQPLDFGGSARFDGGGQAHWHGLATAQTAQVKASLAATPLALAAPYLAQVLAPSLTGLLDADLALDWQAGATPSVAAKADSSSRSVQNHALLQAGERAGAALPAANAASATSAASVTPATAGPVALAAPASTATPQLQPAGPGLRVRIDRLTLSQVALTQTATERRGGNAGPAASVQALQLQQALVDVTRQRVQLGALRLQKPFAEVSRAANGQWMFESWLRHPAPAARRVAASRATASAAAPSRREDASTAAVASAQPARWTVAVEDLQIEGGQLNWRDQHTPRPVALDVSAIKLQLAGLDLAAPGQPAQLQWAAQLGAPGRGQPGSLAWRGPLTLDPVGAKGALEAVRLPAHLLEPYVSSQLNVDLLRADTSFKGQLQFAQRPAGLQLRLQGDAKVQNLQANARPGAAASAAPVATPAAAQVETPEAGAGGAAATPAAAPTAATATAPATTAAPATTRATGSAPAAATNPTPAKALSNLPATTSATAIAATPQAPATGASAAPARSSAASVGPAAAQPASPAAVPPAATPGEKAAAGNDAPTTAAGSAPKSMASASSPAAASATASPAAAPAAPAVARARANANLQLGEELLSWKNLSLRGLDVAVAPGQATAVTVKDTLLSQFYARIIIRANGRINLQDLVKTPAGEAANAADTTAVAAPAADAAAAPQTGLAGSAPAAAPAQPDAAADISGATHSIAQTPAKSSRSPLSAPLEKAPATAPSSTPGAAGQTAGGAPPGPPAVITIGPIRLQQGRVAFSDRFIKPNYSADLTELNGQLSAFSSAAAAGGAPQMAELLLTGRAEGTAALDIKGQLNPLAQPLALDISGKVRELELAPLSPYAIKFAGHGIERGKLSMDVRYEVKPDGQLTASNNLVLNQLTFGERVQGAPGNLPVKLAVALLADSKGVIDINLPVSGSLNDPKFSLGSVIFRVIINLIVKAVTAPFALLANAFGGGDGQDFSQVPFAPGSATLSSEAQASLDKIAKALSERPTLKMTVVGTASLDGERDGWRKERIKALVLAEKRRQMAVKGAAPDTAQDDAPDSPAADATAEKTAEKAARKAAPLAVSADEYPALLKEVYRRADVKKPRNPIGIAKDLPPAEMEAVLAAGLNPNEEMIRELALQRGVAVRDYLLSRQLPSERLFVGAPRVGTPAALAAAQAAAGGAAQPSGATATTAADKGWTPRAELGLAMR